jgi:putative CocE/NonD family hydrolase
METLVPQNLSVAIFKNDSNNPIWGITDKLNFYVFGPVPKYIGSRDGYLGNYWTSVPKWPAYTKTNYYFLPGGVLSTSKPNTAFNTTYTYDPNNPSPAIGANTLFSSTPCGPRDQAKIESRSDVVKWTSAPLTAPMAVVGQLTASLTVASSAIDTDFYVTVTDIYPTNNMSVNVRYGAIRMRWRDSDNVTSMMVPGQAYQVTLDLWSTAYIFNVGHSIRVHITSSRVPEFTVNPNNGYPLVNTTGPIIVAQNTIIQDPAKLSYITFPVVDLKDIPVNPKIH